MLDLNEHFDFSLISRSVWNVSDSREIDQLSRDLLKLYKGSEIVLHLGDRSRLPALVEHLESLGYFCVRIGNRLIVSRQPIIKENEAKPTENLEEGRSHP